MRGERLRVGLRGWVLYDDSCGFCRSWVPFWRNALLRRGFGIAPLQSEWVAMEFKIPQGELVGDLRLLLSDGRRLAGADVYRYVMRRIWWALPLYVFAALPGTRSVFNWGYRTFAANRFRVSRACGLGSPRATTVNGNN
jgi:predicted DCC family thiol-disulfide oxidoreductase YuxK